MSLENKKNYYIGIDLGTTNSLMAWGTINANNRQIEPRVVPIEMMIRGGGVSKKELLPSCVYFKDKATHIVGDYAKDQYGRSSSRVIKSIKSSIGKTNGVTIDGVQHSPQGVSSFILKHLAQSAEKHFGFIPDDVVITVPASFDSDMRNATIESARLAGFKVTEDDGSPRQILLDEPRAALFDFINRQSRGEIPDSLIDFTSKNTVLVFDLGGGTLDVSLHGIYTDGETGQVEIDDYAISRYTQIGGDNFDELLADKFLQAFSRKVDLSKLHDFDRNELRSKFISFAEDAKIAINDEIKNREFMGRTDYESVCYELLHSNVFDNRSFEYDLSYAEFEGIISPLLGEGLTLASVSTIDALPEDKIDNIIYPILDVLQKGQEKIGHLPEVGAVILNGGMTKLYTISKRLESFFGFKPISAGDPDKAVARGAVVYHYNLHRGLRAKTILNDSIGLLTKGGYVKHIVAAGTVLPYRSKPITDFVIDNDGATVLDLPFYLGRRKDTMPPNRKICKRRIKFPASLSEGDSVHIQVNVDESNIMTVDGWLEANPQIKFSVTVVSEEEKPRTTAAPTLITAKRKPQPFLPHGPEMSVNDTINTMIVAFRRHSDGNAMAQRMEMDRIKALEAKIIRARNGVEFSERLIALIENLNPFALSRVIYLLGQLAAFHEEIRVDVCRCAMNLTQESYLYVKPKFYLNSVFRYAVDAIGRCGIPLGESHLAGMVGNTEMLSIYGSIMHSLGKVGTTSNTVQKLTQHVDSNDRASRIAAPWAIGKIGSRENRVPLAVELLQDSVLRVCNQLRRETHPDAVRNQIYALGEICDRRLGDRELVSEDLAQQALSAINKRALSSAKAFSRIQSLAIKMIEANELSEEDEMQLLAIRSDLSC